MSFIQQQRLHIMFTSQSFFVGIHQMKVTCLFKAICLFKNKKPQIKQPPCFSKVNHLNGLKNIFFLFRYIGDLRNIPENSKTAITGTAFCSRSSQTSLSRSYLFKQLKHLKRSVELKAEEQACREMQYASRKLLCLCRLCGFFFTCPNNG